MRHNAEVAPVESSRAYAFTCFLDLVTSWYGLKHERLSSAYHELTQMAEHPLPEMLRLR